MHLSKLPQEAKLLSIYSLWLKLPNMPPVCKQYFLYCVLISDAVTSIIGRTTGLSKLDCFDYKREGLFVTNTTVAMFMERYSSAGKDEEEKFFDISASGLFSSVIYHDYPVMLRSVLDKVSCTQQPADEENTAYCILRWGDVYTVKHIPTLMSSKDPIRRDIFFDNNAVTVVYSKSTVTCYNTRTEIVSKDRDAHYSAVKTWEHLLGFKKSAGHDVYRYSFVLPDNIVSFHQVYSALIKRDPKLRTVTNSRSEFTGTNIDATDFLESHVDPDFTLMIADVTLKTAQVYKNTKYSYCLAAGDSVLSIFCIPTNTTEDDESYQRARKAALTLLRWADKESTTIPKVNVPISSTNIAQLRSKDPVLFGQEFCRSVPPRCQPIWIDPEHVETERQKGKIIIFYRGNYYTTKDKRYTQGMDYIGFINTVSSKKDTSLPIIRAYLTNHLKNTKKYRQIKQWALSIERKEHGDAGISGKLDPKYIILPDHLKHWYDVVITNPAPVVGIVHTKKTTMTKSEKVASGELPDYIKTLFEYLHITRLVIQREDGNGLLEACGIPKQHREDFLKDVLKMKDSVRDLDGKDEESMTRDVMSGNVDHRVYGKVLERVLYKCIVVFSPQGVIPYRYSLMEADNILPLYLLPNNVYDYINTKVDLERDKRLLSNLKAFCNSNVVIPAPMNRQRVRSIDYTKVCIGLVSYISRWLKDNNIAYVYDLIHEDTCKELCESVYVHTLYEETHVPFSEKYTSRECIQRCTTFKRKLLLSPDADQVFSIFTAFLSAEGNDENLVIHVKSPADLTGRWLWNLTLEGCLYFDHNSYIKGQTEEIILRRLE